MPAKKKSRSRRKYSTGHYRVPLSDCIPNDWNMNKVEPDVYRKLKLNIEETLSKAGVLPPILCRPHPGKKEKGKLQIIDGEHRWKILRELEYEDIDAFVVDVDTATAMIMTDTMNYLRGDPDPDKYGEYMARMIREHTEVDVEYLAERLPESEDEITELIAGLEIDIEDVVIEDSPSSLEGADSKDASTKDVFVELNFHVSKEQAAVIEAEVRRISGTLEGKNVRGRALEFMAVQSSQTPMESVIGDPDTDTRTRLVVKAKKRKRKAA